MNMPYLLDDTGGKSWQIRRGLIFGKLSVRGALVCAWRFTGRAGQARRPLPASTHSLFGGAP
jgi:hypothetical protein